MSETLYNAETCALCGPSHYDLASGFASTIRVKTPICGLVFLTFMIGVNIWEVHWSRGMPDIETQERVYSWLKSEGYFQRDVEPVAQELLD
jgi:hypothetical protein